MSDRTLAEKLFLKPGRNLVVLNAPQGYPEKLGPLPDFAKIVDSSEPADVLLLFALNSAELSAQFQKTIGLLNAKTVFWVCYPKLSGSLKGDLSREIIVAYTVSLGWKGVFMISLDEDWSAMRLMPQ